MRKIESLTISLISIKLLYSNLEKFLIYLTIHLLLMKNFKNKYLYEEKGLLGEGSFGKVYKGKDKDTDEVVAIKCNIFNLMISNCYGLIYRSIYDRVS